MKVKRHRPAPFPCKRIPYIYCLHCGIIYMKNKASRKAIRKPCPGEEYDLEFKP